MSLDVEGQEVTEEVAEAVVILTEAPLPSEERQSKYCCILTMCFKRNEMCKTRVYSQVLWPSVAFPETVYAMQVLSVW